MLFGEVENIKVVMKQQGVARCERKSMIERKHNERDNCR